MSWGRHFDDLAAATSALLIDGPDARQVTEPVTALAARDTVLVQLRQLVGAVCEAPRFSEVKPLLLTDIVDRPAKALHQALSALPRAVDFGASEMPDAVDLTLPAYEQHWQRAALAALALEKYVDPVGRLPDGVAWFVLRDLADLANGLVYLDRDLSEAVLPRVKAGEDLGVQYAALTSTGHSVVRLAAGEIRARVPAYVHDTEPNAQLLRRGPAEAGELDQAIGRYLGNVTANAEQLSVPNLRAMTRLIEFGSRDAGRVLDRVSGVVAGAGDTARALAALGPIAWGIRETPSRSTAQPHLAVIGGSSELGTRMAALAGRADRLAGGASQQEAQRLAAPALEFASRVPALTQALELSVRESLAAGVLLVPNAPRRSNPTALSWVTVGMGPQADGPPAVHRGAIELVRAGAAVGIAARTAEQALSRHQAVEPTSSQRAVATAVTHAGAARNELRAVLAQRVNDLPAALAGPLPTHPRMAAVRPGPTMRS